MKIFVDSPFWSPFQHRK